MPSISQERCRMNISCGKYGKITVKSGAADSISRYVGKNRHVLILTDSGVPCEYAERISSGFENAVICRTDSGEGSKSLSCVWNICEYMLSENFTRHDALISLGGGVVSDIGGFVSSVYMRGIDFYCVPTTMLSMADAAVGGKNGVNLHSVKNVIGTFRFPKHTIIDPCFLKTLDKRMISSGIAEIIKIAAVLDGDFFERMERDACSTEELIAGAVKLKCGIVKQDPYERGVRRVLNFGHTVGHAVESLGGRSHGECVALGMLVMSSPSARQRIAALCSRYGLPTSLDGIDTVATERAIVHDKKSEDGYINCILCENIGTYREKKLTVAEITEMIDDVRSVRH